MSEGKLKELIFDKSKPHLPDNDGSVLMVYAEHVSNVLATAKQEYMKKCKPETKCNCQECNWFKKWFGE